MDARRRNGFTLIEVLIAMSITAFVSVIAYSALANVLSGVEGLRVNADRIYEVNRAWMIISRDLRQFSPRPVRDEFGQEEAAMTGGQLARFTLSFTRSGWHNPGRHPRSNLQRINYRIEDEALWRDAYYVLDRAGDTQPETVMLLDKVEVMDIAFLGSLDSIQRQRDSTALETDQWPENWVSNASAGNAPLPPPVALEITLQLQDWGEMRRLYALPPL